MTIRLRVAVVFTVALAAAFILGSWLLLGELRAQLLRNTDAALAGQLTTSGQYLHRQLPEEFPFLVQLINPAGRVVRRTGDAGQGPVVPVAAARQHQITGYVTVDEERYRVLAGPLPGNPGWVGVVGQRASVTNTTVAAQETRLVIGGAIVVLLAGLGAYWLAGAALAPVERMRRQVAALSERDAAGGVLIPRTRDELARLARTMNDLLARLHSALARQRGFVADASHELRTPLAVLGAELELAGRPGRSRDELAEALSNAQFEVVRLTRIVNDLLVLARSDEGRLELRRTETDVRELLSLSVTAAAARASAAGVECVADAPAGLVELLDADRVRQAVDNLIDNALRFAPPGSRVTATAAVSNGGLAIEVADAGPGFPADFLPQAFERFSRPDTSRARSDGGAGLGLAIVAVIAAAHGGTATARNRQGGGAVVTMTLPSVAATI